MKDDVQRRPHSHEVAPATALLDLQQHTVFVGVDLLRVEVLRVEPATQVADDRCDSIRRTRVTTTLRSRNPPGTSGRYRQRTAATQTKSPIGLSRLLTLGTAIRRH